MEVKSSTHKVTAFFKEVGKLITKYREEMGFTFEQLGLMIGSDGSNVFKMEKGRPMNIRTIIKLSIALKKEPHDFFLFKSDFQEHELGSLIVEKKSPKKKSIPTSSTKKRMLKENSKKK